MTDRLFVRTETPRAGAAGTARPRWLTWSAAARRDLRQLAGEIPRLRPPRLEYFQETEYGYTLAWDVAGLQPVLKRRLGAMAQALYRMQTPAGLILFDRLIDDVIDGATLRHLFAFIRSHLVAQTGDELVAIYAPLGAVGGTEQKDFPLHADLYPPVILFNVFDRVPADGSGGSLFLPMPELLRAVGRLGSIPPASKRRFRALLTRPSNTDHYEELYNLLHGENPWKEELEDAMAAATVRIPLARGQGYLVHDRLWLHGRDAPRGRVPKNRLHRLIFDTAGTRQVRLRALRRAARLAG